MNNPYFRIKVGNIIFWVDGEKWLVLEKNKNNFKFFNVTYKHIDHFHKKDNDYMPYKII